MNYLFVESIQLIFGRTKNSDIMKRKKQWLLNELKESNGYIDKCKVLINIVVKIMPDWRIEYLIEFLKINKDIDDFKRIRLFPTYNAWSGSEIPLIIEDIKFLKSLNERINEKIKGVEYIQHKKYIEECCRSAEEYKRKVELQEYIENSDYA